MQAKVMIAQVAVALACLSNLCLNDAVAKEKLLKVRVGQEIILIRAKQLDDGYDVKGGIVADRKFLIQTRRAGKADIVIYRAGIKLYTMPDAAIHLPNGEYYPPGMTYKGYDFFLSPSQNYLFVVRGLVNDESVGYLYHRASTSRMRLVCPFGLRFDQAAIRCYARQQHIHVSKLEFYSRLIRMVEWTAGENRLVFRMSAASFWYGGMPRKGDVDVTWYGYYDLRRNTFGTIKNPSGLPEPVGV